MCEHMHNDVHVTRMYKGERVGPYLSHSFVTVTLLTVTFCTIKTPYGAHNRYTIFPSTLVSFPFCLSLQRSLYRNPRWEGGEAKNGFTLHPNNIIYLTNQRPQYDRFSHTKIILGLMMKIGMVTIIKRNVVIIIDNFKMIGTITDKMTVGDQRQDSNNQIYSPVRDNNHRQSYHGDRYSDEGKYNKHRGFHKRFNKSKGSRQFQHNNSERGGQDVQDKTTPNGRAEWKKWKKWKSRMYKNRSHKLTLLQTRKSMTPGKFLQIAKSPYRWHDCCSQCLDLRKKQQP